MNASVHFVKEKPKNVLTNGGIAAIVEVYRGWKTQEGFSKVVAIQEVQTTDYNISPTQFIDLANIVHYRPIEEILADIISTRTERERADRDLTELLTRLCLRI